MSQTNNETTRGAGQEFVEDIILEDDGGYRVVMIGEVPPVQPVARNTTATESETPARAWAKPPDDTRSGRGGASAFWALMGILAGAAAAIYVLPRFVDRIPPGIAQYLPQTPAGDGQIEIASLREDLSQDIGGLSEQVARLEDSLRGEIGGMGERLGSLRAELDILREDDAQAAAAPPVTQALEAQFAALEARLDTLSQTIEAERQSAPVVPPAIDERITALEAQADAIKAGIDAGDETRSAPDAALLARVAETDARAQAAQEAVTRIGQQLAANNAERSELNERLASQTAFGEELGERLDTLSAQLTAQRQEIEAAIGAVQQSAQTAGQEAVDQVTQRLDALEAAQERLLPLEARVGALGETLAATPDIAPLTGRLSALEEQTARLDTIDERLTALAGAIDALPPVSPLAEQLETQGERLAVVDTRLGRLDEAVETLPETTTRVTAPLIERLEALEAETAAAGETLQDRLAGIEARLAQATTQLAAAPAGDNSVLTGRIEEIAGEQETLRARIEADLAALRDLSSETTRIAEAAATEAAEASGTASAAMARVADAIDTLAPGAPASVPPSIPAPTATAVALPAAPPPTPAPAEALDDAASPTPTPRPEPAPPLDPAVTRALGELRIAMDAARPFVRELAALEAALGAAAPAALRAPSYGGLASRPSLVTTFDIGAAAAQATGAEEPAVFDAIRADIAIGRLEEAKAAIEALSPDSALALSPLLQRLATRIAAEEALIDFVAIPQ